MDELKADPDRYLRFLKAEDFSNAVIETVADLYTAGTYEEVYARVKEYKSAGKQQVDMLNLSFMCVENKGEVLTVSQDGEVRFVMLMQKDGNGEWFTVACLDDVETFCDALSRYIGKIGADRPAYFYDEVYYQMRKDVTGAWGMDSYFFDDDAQVYDCLRVYSGQFFASDQLVNTWYRSNAGIETAHGADNYDLFGTAELLPSGFVWYEYLLMAAAVCLTAGLLFALYKAGKHIYWKEHDITKWLKIK